MNHTCVQMIGRLANGEKISQKLYKLERPLHHNISEYYFIYNFSPLQYCILG